MTDTCNCKFSVINTKHRNILRHLFLWVLMLLSQLSWGQVIWHEDMGSPAVTGS